MSLLTIDPWAGFDWIRLASTALSLHRSGWKLSAVEA
jgi:hypothetical protein